MHKRKGNALWFDDAAEKDGADSIRHMNCLYDPALALRLGFNALKEPANSLKILSNICNLIEKTENAVTERIEDKWILSKLHSLIIEVTNELEKKRSHTATRMLQNFWLTSLSRGYIQFSRDRLAENDPTVKHVLQEVYLTLLALCAPIIPFTTESVWQELKKRRVVKEDSVHLCNWPKQNDKKIDKKLEDKFDEVMKIIERGLRARDEKQIGLKWPLAKATITTNALLTNNLAEVIARQLNVKRIFSKKGNNVSVELDTTITPELEAEGFAREISRRIQAERKNRNMQKKQRIDIEIFVNNKLRQMLGHYLSSMAQRTGARNIRFVDDKTNRFVLFEVKNEQVGFNF